MQLGLALPQFDYSLPGHDPLDWGAVEHWAVTAEGAGIDTVWLADHLFLPLGRYGGEDEPHRGFDPLVGLGGLAAVTDRVGLGVLVACAPLRPPALLAKAAGSLDVLSGGRLTLGMGAGWLEAEFDAARVPFERAGHRLEQLEEAVRVVKGLAEGGPATFGGRWYGTEAARARPPSPQPGGPPVWIGGKGGPRLLALVARVADGWNTVWRWTPDEYRAKLDDLRRACEREDRDPATITLSVGLTTLVGSSERDLRRRYDAWMATAPPGTAGGETLDEFRRGRLVGTVDQVAEQLGEWRSLGVAHLVANLGAVPFAVAAAASLDGLVEARGKELRDG